MHICVVVKCSLFVFIYILKVKYVCGTTHFVHRFKKVCDASKGVTNLLFRIFQSVMSYTHEIIEG